MHVFLALGKMKDAMKKNNFKAFQSAYFNVKINFLYKFSLISFLLLINKFKETSNESTEKYYNHLKQ